MRVAVATAPAASAGREVEPQRTPVTRAELRGAIARALERADGHRPKDALVDVLTAQACLETASGDRMYNFNFGGIKGRAPDGATATCRTKEVVAGREITIRDGFRAYRSLDDGAADYVRTMRSRFGAALGPAARGDVHGFASALKKAGYYTASEVDYARGLERLIGNGGTPAPRHTSAPALTSPSAPLTAAGLARVESALDLDRFTSLSMAPHRSTQEEEEDM